MNWITENRRICIYIGSAILIFILILSAIFFKLNTKVNEIDTVSIIKNEQIDYKVAYKENEFYSENYIGKGNQYIVSLIDHIVADFKCDLKTEESLEYNYKYKIVDNVKVTDNKTNKEIFKYSEDILEEKTGKGNKNIKINEKVKLDFNKYNDSINKFINTYRLDDVSSEVSFQMNVSVEGKDFKRQNIATMRLDIPLTKNTIAIDIKTGAENTNNTIALNNYKEKNNIFFGIAITLLIADIILFVVCIVLIKVTETDEDKYNRELRKIKNNYDTFITEIENEFCIDGYKLYQVKSFEDLLELRDSLQTQIIMMENKGQGATSFVIPTDNNILYYYLISVNYYALPEGK